MITLMFHRIMLSAEENHYFKRGTAISQAKFEEILNVIDSMNLPVVLPNHDMNCDGVCLTFDDGYKDNLWAFKELNRKGLAAILFPVKNYIKYRFSITDDLAGIYDQDNFDISDDTKDRVRHKVRKMCESRYRKMRSKILGIEVDQCPEGLFMTEQDLKDSAALGMSLGVHGTTHKIWSDLSNDALAVEISESVKWLSNLSKDHTSYLAYPHGKEPSRGMLQRLLGQYINFGVDRNYNNSNIISRVWVKENTDITRVLNEYINKNKRLV